jgi:hypothetical protein
MVFVNTSSQNEENTKQIPTLTQIQLVVRRGGIESEGRRNRKRKSGTWLGKGKKECGNIFLSSSFPQENTF